MMCSSVCIQICSCMKQSYVMITFTPGSFSWEATNTCTHAADTLNHLCAIDLSLSSVTVTVWIFHRLKICKCSVTYEVTKYCRCIKLFYNNQKKKTNKSHLCKLLLWMHSKNGPHQIPCMQLQHQITAHYKQ